MEIIKDVTIYQCSYCGKKMIRRSSVVRHEKLCPYNHGCKTCKFYEECEPETIYDPFHSGNPGSTDYDVPVWWCNARDERIYQYVALCNLWETLSTKTREELQFLVKGTANARIPKARQAVTAELDQVAQ